MVGRREVGNSHVVRFSSMRVCKYVSMQVYKYTRIQVLRISNTLSDVDGSVNKDRRLAKDETRRRVWTTVGSNK